MQQTATGRIPALGRRSEDTVSLHGPTFHQLSVRVVHREPVLNLSNKRMCSVIKPETQLTINS